MEYAVYPFEYMRITQRHDEGNHLAHWQPFKDYSDKPFDEATENGGRGYFVPKNDYRVVEKTGSQDNGYNVRLETVNQVKIPYQNDPIILEVTLTHINYDDWSKLSIGQIIHKNEKIIREGTSGHASGNHLHCTANFGKYYGFKHNSNGKWVFAYDKALEPTQAFFIDNTVNILNSKGYNFQQVPTIYYQKGDCNETIEKVDDYLANKVKGNYFGDYTEVTLNLFKSQNGLEPNGIIDNDVLNKMGI